MAGVTQPSRQLIKGDRRPFSSSEDLTMLKQIQATHSPDGRDVDVRPILDVIEDIFLRAAPSPDGANANQGDQMDSLEGKISAASIDGMLEALAFIIQKVSCELSCKCSSGGDAHGTTMAVLNMLSSYSWDAKVVIALAAFAITYGEFWLVIQLHATHPLAKSVAILKQVVDLIKYASSIKPRFDTLNNLINAVLDVTKFIADFRQLPYQYISPENPPLSTAMTHIPNAAYWTIRSIVACATHTASLIGASYENLSSTTEAWELLSLTHKEINILKILQQQLDLCNKHIDEKKQAEAFSRLVDLFEKPDTDNNKIFKQLLNPRDDQPPLYQSSSKTRVQIEVLRRKIVLLFISDLEVSYEELIILEYIYKESRSDPELQYEIVWIPVVDKAAPWTEARQQKFLQLQAGMPWYSLYHPSLLEPATIRYIKEVWKFAKKMILVAINPLGKVVNTNALHMVWIWGNAAYPFTTPHEESLWRNETWRVELLVDGIDRGILDWIVHGKHICLYGGEDMGWIRQFTQKSKEVAASLQIDLEMVYVGKSKAKERMRKMQTVIQDENLSHFLPDLTSIWYFWTRLESMLYSKMQHRNNMENDLIMQEVMTVLSFDGGDQGWAIFCLGSKQMARAKGDTMLKSFDSFPDWEDDAKEQGFVPALQKTLTSLHTPEHCNRLILPGIEGGIPEKVVCAECGRPMEKYFMYRCCNE